ncbi:NAD(P)/FAD-dependent oxidoreductase [Pseudomonas sp. DWRC2-2]|uniref:NAD(P)/FAD-dependent oxidoreductase n=1 Tax=Pseudomonas sp. DWRC2-2 TaxID=2804567 RepID=UPI003CED9542
MHSDFEVAVVGAGIIGLTTAALFAERGIDTLLVEQSRCGFAGATAHTGGICRAFEPNPQLAWLAEVVGFEPGETHVESILRAHETTTGALYRLPPAFTQAPYDTRVQAISAQAAASLLGRTHMDTGVYYHEPGAAISDVHATMSSLRTTLRKRASVIEHCTVQRLVEGDAHVDVHGLETHYRARHVINAAGASSPTLSAVDGAEVRTIPHFKLRGPTVPTLPCIDFVSGNYLLPLSAELLQSSTTLRPSLAQIADDPGRLPRMVEDCKLRLCALVENIEEYQLLSMGLALDLYTPDGLPRLGPCRPGSRIWLATGLNGIGYKYAYPIATRLYERITQQR